MLRSTFQLSTGIGPRRERNLWESGVVDWREAGSVRGKAGDDLRAGIAAAEHALDSADIERLAALIPTREHWRLFREFSDDAAYIDIETSDDVVGFESISAIGILDRDGVDLFLADRNLAEFPARAARWSMLVSFNGLSFDLPILRRAFPDWTPPACHVDLRHTLARLGAGHDGGLKTIERTLASLHLARPQHLNDLDGFSAGPLFRHGRDGNRTALRRFVEYNLYDVVSLRTLMPYAYNHLAAQTPLTVDKLPVPERGDVLYDISKILLSL
jgi:uncharacterized protein YprB with RNaseH-like and TPR domain